MKTTSSMISTLNSKIEEAQKTLDKFTASLAQDPCYAFSWSAGAFRAAATIKICKEAKELLENGVTVEALRAQLTTGVLDAARSANQSTSPTSNLMDREILAAMADVVEAARW